MAKQQPGYYDGPIWNWFGLSYGNYLVLPRSLMQGMPVEWQEKMVTLLNEMRETYEEYDDTYDVHLVRTFESDVWDEDEGRFEEVRTPVDDPLADYRHPTELPYRVAQGQEEGQQ